MQPHSLAVARPRRSALARLGTWLSLRRERGDLSVLDDRLLRDVGLDRATARREWERPFWDVPPDRPA